MVLPKYVTEKLGKRLWSQPAHPIGILSRRINAFFRNQGFTVLNEHPSNDFINDPFVTVKSNFDDLLIPSDHASRSPSDTFYQDVEEKPQEKKPFGPTARRSVFNSKEGKKRNSLALMNAC